MNVKQVNIVTDTNGDFTIPVRIQGEVLAVALVIGTLSTPDVTITDTLTAEAIFAKTGIAATDSWQPRRLAVSSAGVDLAAAAGPPVLNDQYVPTVCLGTATVLVAGGGSVKSGTLYIAYRG